MSYLTRHQEKQDLKSQEIRKYFENFSIVGEHALMTSA